MRLWLRLQDRVFSAFAAILAVTSTIGCVVSVATAHWARLPVELLIAVSSSSLVLVRRHARSSAGSAGGALTVMRYVFLEFTASLVSFAAVIASLPDTSTGSPRPWLFGLFGLTLLCVVLPTLVERPLDDSSAGKLFESYSTRFFLRIAFGESIALFSFTFTFLGAPPWIYYVGCAIALVRLWTNAAPTRGAIERDQAVLTARGSQLSLVAALRAGSTRRD